MVNLCTSFHCESTHHKQVYKVLSLWALALPSSHTLLVPIIMYVQGLLLVSGCCVHENKIVYKEKTLLQDLSLIPISVQNSKPNNSNKKN